ncbi:MAG TPA: GNAT family protein [Chitinophagaceae bacterium]|nr:GNAT family protein [Chitinophagaceae bacterium]
MFKEILTVREIGKQDIIPITDYWLNSSPAFMQSMGVDLNKMPKKEQWREMLSEQLSQPYEEKKSYCIIWQAEDKAVGHSNINKINFGVEAYMHLHIWDENMRKKGFGTSFIKMTLPYFFSNYQLKKLYSEPYALNPAPNKTLAKAGFEFVKEYITTPGWLNFEQPVKLWVMNKEKFSKLGF